MPLSRRDFVRSAAGLAAAGLSGELVATQTVPPPAPRAGAKRPVLVSSANGFPSCEKAAELIRAGADPLDAVVAGINIVEDDPSDHSVGYGGLPNEEGVVQLDSCVMDGRTHKAGAVAAIENIRNPSSVAKLVMRRTDHVLLVGDGARRFAKAHGFKEENLLTDAAREIWLKWKETHSDNDDWISPATQPATSRGPADDILHTWGTITCMALVDGGDMVGCTSTSGLSYKLPGRVGDSPIIGAGLFVDNAAGACGSTGRGEANLQNLSSFLVVELMRAGRTPEEACLETLRRVASNTEPRLLNPRGEPDFQLTLYALRNDGLVGGATIRGTVEMSVHDGEKTERRPLPALYA